MTEHQIARRDQLIRQATVTQTIPGAVNWWCKQLLGTPDHDNGDALQSTMTSFVASRVCKPIDEYRIESFREALEIILITLVARHMHGPEQWRLCIGTDYGPDHYLHMALELAGIENGDLRLPIKTRMFITYDACTVSAGYRAEEQVVATSTEREQ